ncbi:diguanylate cyclase [Arcobacter arenosus]|jgi:diguanylate cyclase (GGDEF)-like protein|uniref:diguanylate cyclase n=1 Tax=Arcobacter arenosus TaxID=2576037 RepID=A0A5R8XY19_9BACT|nr:diguanylate cyclase [Arcobacter arenosus]TLP35753.1 diguanylate cyclase [Arcobacter arenosus]
MSANLKELLEHTQTLSVLFIEDNFDVRIQLVKLLENFFSDIDVEVDGEEGLKRFKEYYSTNGTFYDLIITDLSMPRFDGISLCKEISKINEDQTILVISAHTESEKLIKLIDIGIYKFLQKPVDYRDLLSTITSISEKLKSRKSFKQLKSEVKSIRNNNVILNQLAITDKLTSIYNRRYLDNILLEKIEKFNKKEQKKLSIIFIDIDDFKKINDNFGHVKGDKVLVEFSEIIKYNIRTEDIFGRWGGEEFIIISESSLETTVEIANKLKNVIEEHTFCKDLELTSSFGITTCKYNDTLSTIIQKADYALYQAKKNGKNQAFLIE